MYNHQARVAADWWIEAMKKRCHSLYPKKVTGTAPNLLVIDDSFAQQLSHFHALLTSEIQFCLEKHSYLSLTCCYFPNAILSRLARKSGISNTCFPIDANMEISNQKIQVSLNSEPSHPLPLPAAK